MKKGISSFIFSLLILFKTKNTLDSIACNIMIQITISDHFFNADTSQGGPECIACFEMDLVHTFCKEYESRPNPNSPDLSMTDMELYKASGGKQSEAEQMEDARKKLKFDKPVFFNLRKKMSAEDLKPLNNAPLPGTTPNMSPNPNMGPNMNPNMGPNGGNMQPNPNQGPQTRFLKNGLNQNDESNTISEQSSMSPYGFATLFIDKPSPRSTTETNAPLNFCSGNDRSNPQLVILKASILFIRV